MSTTEQAPPATTPAPVSAPAPSGRCSGRATRRRADAPPGGVRRVRHQAREALAVMAFSATTSLVLASGLLLLTTLGR